MWERENSSSKGILQRITVLLVFGFVLLQLAVFIRDAFRHQPSPVPAPEVIHDTVFIVEKVFSSPASGNIRSRSRKSEHVTDSVAAEKFPAPAPVPRQAERIASGHSEWKWDVVELNSADSSALDDLPGIGGYYAKQILRLRERLGAFTEPGQLLEIRGMDSARLARIVPRVRIDSSYIQWIDLRTVPEETLARHPYVGKIAARGIVRLRGTLPPDDFSLKSIVDNGVLTEEAAARLGRYVKR